MSGFDGPVGDTEQQDAALAAPAPGAVLQPAGPAVAAAASSGRAGRPPPMSPPVALALQQTAGNGRVAAHLLGRTVRAAPVTAAPAVDDEGIAAGLRASVDSRRGGRLLREPAPAAAGDRPQADLSGLPPQVADRIRSREREAAEQGGDGAQPAEQRGEVDRSKLAAERGPLESETKAGAPKPEAKIGEMQAAASAAKEAADAPVAPPPAAAAAAAAAPPGATGGAPSAAPAPAGGAGAGGPGAGHMAAAAAAQGAMESVSPPDEPPPVAVPEPVIPVDAGGAPLPGAPEAEATTAALTAKAQILREQGHALRQEAAGERAGAHALGAQIAESLAGVADAEDAITRSREGLDYRRGVQGQAKQALNASEEKQAMVAEQAPELSAKAAEQKADSGPMAGEASSLAGESKAKSGQADDEEAAAKANEQGGQLEEISGKVGSVDDTFGQSKQRADALTQEAAQAKASNDATAAKVAESDAAIAQTDSRVGELDADNQAARARLDSYADGPAELEQGAQDVDATGQGLIEASLAIEQRIAAAAESHRAGMAAVPAREERAAGGSGPGGTLARSVEDEEQRYDQRTNLNLAGGLAELVGPTALYGSGSEPPSAAERREAQARELARREAEVREINDMCDGHFERLGPGTKALHALKLMGRHLWGGVSETKWPQFARHLAQALIDPRISLMGIVSGLSMALSGVANIANVQAWKTDPVGNALKIAADIATGITIVLASVVGLATAILALAWALAIITFGLAGGVAAVLTPICTTVISTVFPWTVIAAKWALGLQALLLMKNLVDAATATSASDLQNQADQMTEDSKQGLAMAAIIVTAKAGEAGGRALANTRVGQAIGQGVRSVGEWANIYPAGGAAGAAGATGATAAAGEGGAAAAGESAAGEAAAGARPGPRGGTSEPPPVRPGETPPARPTETPAPAERAPAPVEEPVGCFVAGTPVLTATGLRAIETLTRGTFVLAGDPGGDDGERPVRRVWIHHASSVLELTIDGRVLTCTGAHPFWVGGEWRPASRLAAGDVLTTPGGGSSTVERVDRRAGDFRVYNLAVAGRQTYYVGDARVLVHNKAKRNTAVPDPPEVAAVRDTATAELDRLHGRANAAARTAEALPERPELSQRATELQERLNNLDDAVQEAPGRPEIEALESQRAALERELAALEEQLREPPPPSEPAPAEETPPAPAAETPEGAQMRQAADEIQTAAGRSRELLRDPAVRGELAKNGALKGELEGSLRSLDDELAAARADAQAAAELGDAELIADSQNRLADLRSQAEALEGRLNDLKSGGGGGAGATKMAPADSPVWNGFRRYRGQTRTDGNQLYEWDFTHGDIEVYNARGEHLGSMDPTSGAMTKPAVRGRTIDI